jgi:hypothetical protein
LCAAAAGATLVATGLAHLLLVSTPRPLAYLGWIVGLVTAAATVPPLVGGTPLPEALAGGVVRLVPRRPSRSDGPSPWTSRVLAYRRA